jgi:hypothetical protein
MTAACPRCGYRPELLDIALELGIDVDQYGMISERAAAKLTGLKPKTLRNWRSQGKGPNYFHRGKRIKYRLEDLSGFGLCR